MGAAVSSSIAVNTISSLTTVVNSVVSNSTQSIITNCENVNEFQSFIGQYPTDIKPDGEIILTQCSPPPNVNTVRITQNAINTCTTQGGLTSEVVQNVNNNLSNEIDQWLQANASANNGFLGFGISIAQSEGINRSELATRIANTVTSNLSQTCNSSVLSTNDGRVYFCGGNEGSDIIVTQNAVNTNLTSCMVDNIVKGIASNTVLNDIAQRAIVQAEAKNEGLGSLFGWVKWLIIAAVIIAVVIIIGIIIYFITSSGKGKKPEEKMSDGRKILEECEKDLRGEIEGKSFLEKKKLVEKCVLKKRESLENKNKK
jgi:uncharacterized membrane protein